MSGNLPEWAGWPFRIISRVPTRWARRPTRGLLLLLLAGAFVWFGFWISGRHLAGYSLLLAQLTSVGLPVAIAAGWRWPAAWLWGWTDPVYYLLGVIGVILLFVSSERERTIADLRVRLERVAADQQQYDATPMQAIGETGSFFLKTAYEGIHVFEELGKVCQDSHLSDGRCIEADGLKDAIDGAYMGFTLPS